MGERFPSLEYKSHCLRRQNLSERWSKYVITPQNLYSWRGPDYDTCSERTTLWHMFRKVHIVTCSERATLWHMFRKVHIVTCSEMIILFHMFLKDHGMTHVPKGPHYDTCSERVTWHMFRKDHGVTYSERITYDTCSERIIVWHMFRKPITFHSVTQWNS